MLIGRRGLLSWLFVNLGKFLPDYFSNSIRTVGERIDLGSWYARHFSGHISKTKDRFGLFSAAASNLPSKFVYLEFGVASGTTIRFAMQIFKNFSVEYHGFDTFKGIPDAHHEGVLKGSFDNKSQPPNIPGVDWHIGLFQNTFTGQEDFLDFPKFIVLDANLYASTYYVLSKPRERLLKDDLIYFDDLHVPNQERLASTQFLSEGAKFKLLAHSREGRSSLFQVTK